MEILGTSMLLLGLLCVSAAVPLPTTTRPSRGNRTIPPDLVLPKDIEVLQVRKQRQVNISESLATEPLKPSDWESLAARKRNRTDTANESAIKEISTPSRKQDNGQVDYYYYYFDSFQEAVTDIADFDDMREGVARHEVEVKQNNSLVVEPLTIASWHTSQKSPGG